MSTTYRTVVIAGRTRLTRSPSVLLPLPQTRCDRQVNRYARVGRDDERTVARAGPLIWTPGYVLTRT